MPQSLKGINHEAWRPTPQTSYGRKASQNQQGRPLAAPSIIPSPPSQAITAIPEDTMAIESDHYMVLYTFLNRHFCWIILFLPFHEREGWTRLECTTRFLWVPDLNMPIVTGLVGKGLEFWSMKKHRFKCWTWQIQSYTLSKTKC